MQFHQKFSNFQQQFNNFQQSKYDQSDQLIDFSEENNLVFQKKSNLSYNQVSNQNKQYEFRQSSKERKSFQETVPIYQDYKQFSQKFETLYDHNSNSQKKLQEAGWNFLDIGKTKLISNNSYKQNENFNDDQQQEIIKDYALEKKYFSNNKLSLNGFKQSSRIFVKEQREQEPKIIDFSQEQQNLNSNRNYSQTYRPSSIRSQDSMDSTKNITQQNERFSYKYFQNNQQIIPKETNVFKNVGNHFKTEQPVLNSPKQFIVTSQIVDDSFQKTPGFLHEKQSLTPFYDEYKYNQPVKNVHKIFNQNKEQTYLDNQFFYQNGMSSEYKAVKLKTSKHNSKNNSKCNSAKKLQDSFQIHVNDYDHQAQEQLYQLFSTQIEILLVLEAKKIDLSKRPDFRIVDLFNKISKMNNQISLEQLNCFFQEFVGILPDNEDLKQFFQKYSNQSQNIEMKQFSLMFQNQSRINESRLMNSDQPLQDDFSEQTNNLINDLLKAHLNATVSFIQLKNQKLNLKNVFHSIQLDNDQITEQILRNLFDSKQSNHKLNGKNKRFMF